MNFIFVDDIFGGTEFFVLTQFKFINLLFMVVLWISYLNNASLQFEPFFITKTHLNLMRIRKAMIRGELRECLDSGEKGKDKLWLQAEGWYLPIIENVVTLVYEDRTSNPSLSLTHSVALIELIHCCSFSFASVSLAESSGWRPYLRLHQETSQTTYIKVVHTYVCQRPWVAH